MGFCTAKKRVGGILDVRREGGKKKRTIPNEDDLVLLLVNDGRLDLLFGLADALAILGKGRLRVGVAELSLDDGEILLLDRENVS